MDSSRRPTEITNASKSVSSTTSDISLLSVSTGKTKSGRKKKGKTKLSYFWSSEDVSKWLRKHCMEYYNLYHEVFTQHDINGRSLVRLSDIKLQRMGIKDETHREEILRHIMRLKLQTEEQELETLDQKKTMSFDR